MAEDFGIEAAAASTTRSARCATSSKTICSRCSALVALGASDRPRAKTACGTAGWTCSARSPRPTHPATSAASTPLPRGRRRQAGVDDQIRGPPPRGRQLALVRRAVLHPGRQGDRGRGSRRSRSSSSAHRRASHYPRRIALWPHPNQLILRIDPEPGRRPGRCRPKKPGADTTRAPWTCRWSSPRNWAKRPEPYERLLGDALRGNASLFIREDSVEETWRIVAAAAREAAAGADLRPRLVGAGGCRRVADRRLAVAPAVAARTARLTAPVMLATARA